MGARNATQRESFAGRRSARRMGTRSGAFHCEVRRASGRESFRQATVRGVGAFPVYPSNEAKAHPGTPPRGRQDAGQPPQQHTRRHAKVPFSAPGVLLVLARGGADKLEGDGWDNMGRRAGAERRSLQGRMRLYRFVRVEWRKRNSTLLRSGRHLVTIGYVRVWTYSLSWRPMAWRFRVGCAGIRGSGIRRLSPVRTIGPRGTSRVLRRQFGDGS